MWWHIDETEEGVRRQPASALIRKVVPLFAPHKHYLFAAFGLLFIITASQLAGPWILQYIIDEVINDSGSRAGDESALLVAAALYIGVVVVGTGVGYVQGITLFRLGINIVSDLKERLFRHVLRLGLEFHEDHSPGKLISRVESDTETLKELFSDVSLNLLRNALTFIGILVILCIKDFGIAVWILLFVPLLFGATFWFINYMRKYWREWRAQWARVTGYVTEYVQGIDVIQQFNYQQTALRRMREVNLGKYRIEVPAMFLDYSFWGAFMFGEIVAIIIVLGIGINGVLAGTMQLGIIVLFIEYIRLMFFPIMQLSEQLNFIQRSLISVERVFGILETEPSVKDGPLPTELVQLEHEIRFENVWFAYEGEEWVLKDVSFTIPKGQNVALVGQSGGGKSTIVNLLLRFYDPQRGRITVDGIDLRELKISAWRKAAGLVLQDVFLFPGSVTDNIRVFDDSISEAKVTEVAGVAKATELIAKLPDGYEARISERGANLSVGERQLLSFARALAYDPQLLVLDEATSSVDPHTERLVQDALHNLLIGRTALIVAHRLSTIQNADNILLVHGGVIAEQGTHAQLVAAGGLYSTLVRLQFGERGAA
ncbi:MAG TPA: ABC transporter ATP-binding protein [Firmicutes bacterium]|nr:ABC transporter ATP-binding protein [Bacillota bacterium]